MEISEPRAITVRSWEPGRPPEQIDESAITATLEAGIPIWVDVTSIMDPVAVGQQLSLQLPQLRADMIAELINPPTSVAGYGPVRLVRWALFDAPTVTPGADPLELFVAGLHILRGPGWLVTFRGASWEAAGGASSGRLDADALIASAHSEWNRSDQTVDDLVTLWLLDLARAFQTSASNLARYLLNADHARWDSSLVAPTTDDLRRLAFRIDTLSIQGRGLQRPGLPPTEAWFSPIVQKPAAEEIAVLLDGTVAFLDGVRRDVRAVLDQRLAEAAEIEREDADRQSRRVALVVGILASVFLGPTLVATIFGAFPTWFVGDAGSRATALGASAIALVVMTGLGLWASAVAESGTAFDRTRLSWAVGLSALVAVVAALIIAGLDDGPPAQESATVRALSRLESTADDAAASQAQQLRALAGEQQILLRRVERLQRALNRPGARARRGAVGSR